MPAVDCRKYKNITPNGGFKKFSVTSLDKFKISSAKISRFIIFQQIFVINFQINGQLYYIQYATSIIFDKVPPFRDK